MKTVVVVPTYNEAEGIVTLLDAVLRRGAGRRRARRGRQQPRRHGAHWSPTTPRSSSVSTCSSRAQKDGLGAAYRAGFGWALSGSYEAVVQMDADLSHPPERLPALLAALEHADVAIGSRYVRGGGVRDWPWRRRAVSLGRQRLRSPRSSGSRSATRRRASRPSVARALEQIGAVHSESNGYCFQIENTWRASRLGLRITEVPITFRDRTRGESKMSGDIVREAMLRVLTWRWREITHEVDHGVRREHHDVAA